MRRRSSDTARRAGLLGVAVALAAALAAAGARLADRASGGTLAEAPRRGARTLRGRFKRAGPEAYTCQCGTEYRVFGTDRHTVYWPASAPKDEPVLGDDCVECGEPLPAGSPTRPV
jgi:hypothetical protein